MESLDTIINESSQSREVKRALSVKMVLAGMKPSQVSALLNVSPQYVSKWRVRYEAGGASCLRLGHRGSQSFLSAGQCVAVLEWIQEQSGVSVEFLRDYVQEQFDVLYLSRQSYTSLLHAAGLSYHKSQKWNPKRDEAQVRERRAAIKKNWRSTKTK